MALPADLIEFLRELELNNNRDWFTASKKRYETSVRAPMEAFAAELIERLRELYPNLAAEPKDVLFRIYRDVRFSKDKTPYKTETSLAIGEKAKHDRAASTFYVHIGPRDAYYGSGYYMLEPEALRKVRAHLASNLGELEDRLNDVPFKRAFGTINGERGKVLPPELRAAAAAQPILFNKQFYYGAQFEPEEALAPDFAARLVELERAALPMNQFLSGAFK
ncbi:MAG TPA: DUF2461 domain-containing protein [Fimbriimonadaceae bacterium]|nr:DUF2461 domain-containing protein [Fimbriimonadaceae bacterium]